MVRITAGAFGPVLHAQRQRLAEQGRAEDQVDLAPGHVDEVRAQLPRHEVEDDGQRTGRGHRPQRHIRLVRNHLVVDDRGRQARHQHQQVRQQRRRQRRAVVGHEAAQRAPQPVARRVGECGGLFGGGVLRRRLGRRLRRGDERDAAVFGFQLGQACRAGMVLGPGHDDVVARGIGRIARHHDAGIALFQQQHRGQQQVVQLGQRALHEAGRVARFAQHTQGLIGADAAHHRKPREQRLHRAFAAVMAGQPGECVRQGIVVEVPGRLRDAALIGGPVVIGTTRTFGTLGTFRTARRFRGSRLLGHGPCRESARAFSRARRAPGARTRLRCRARSAVHRRAARRGRVRPDSASSTPRAPACCPA